jgi:outer membrane receptor protein involved in Fe transport
MQQARPATSINNNPLNRHLAAAALALCAAAAPWQAHAADPFDNSSAQQQSSLETVLVYGEKTRRSLMDTASSVAVFGQDDIARRPGVATTSDLLDHIPNLVVTEPSNLAPAVRGVDGTGPAQGADAFFAGVRPRLNFQTDGRTLSYNEAIFSDATLWDIDRIEVFRGPQSTLQGRNSIGGAIVTRTKNPTYAFEGAARVIGGSGDMREYSAAVSGPIIDNQLAVRLAYDERSSETFVHGFTPYPHVGDPGLFKSTMLRGKLLFEPQALPQLSTLLTLSRVDAYAPQGGEVVRPFGDHDASYPPMPRFGTLADNAIATINWAFDDTLALETVLSATQLEVRRSAEPGDGIAKIDANEYVAEPRLKFTLDAGRLTGFVGAHVFHNDQDEYIDLFGGGTFDDSTDTYALFGESTLQTDANIDITLGGRFERERHQRSGGVGPFAIDFDETYKVFLPKLSVAWRVDPDLTLGFVVSRGYNGGGAGFTYDVPFTNYLYKPEYLWNYEAFSRASLFGGRLSLVGNVFYNRYKDMQLPFDLNPDPAVWSYVVRNADEAETYGAELNTRLQLQPNLEVFANLGLLKTEISRYAGSGVQGNELARAPAYSVDFGATYTHASGIELNVDARYSDAYYSDVNNDPRGRIDPYWVANAQIAYTLGKARVFAAVKNIFDRTQPLLISPGDDRADDVATLMQPRTVSMGVQLAF